MNNEFQRGVVELLPRLRRFAYALTGDLDQADDLVQEACVKALSKAEQWQPGTRLDSWMYRIAQNAWYDRMRARKTRGEVVDIDGFAQIAGSDGRDVIEQRSTLAQVSRGISKLPQDQQILIALVCVDGLSYKEAADALQLPIGTVMSRLSRARRSLNLSLTVASPATPTASNLNTPETLKTGIRHDRNLR
ncbi:MAG: RNA polymerase sigma factor [Hyphomicrobiaceae bacterium]|nr:RNA polymerase sigma factor [Hyphomicrobiaceae bacterium]